MPAAAAGESVMHKIRVTMMLPAIVVLAVQMSAAEDPPIGP
jgi:hypothetical protein